MKLDEAHETLQFLERVERDDLAVSPAGLSSVALVRRNEQHLREGTKPMASGSFTDPSVCFEYVQRRCARA